MKKRPIVYLITAALLTLTVSGCGSEKAEKQTKQPTEKEPTKVILNEVAHSIFYAPMYAACLLYTSMSRHVKRNNSLLSERF